MIELSYSLREGEWSLVLRGEWDPADRIFGYVVCNLVCGGTSYEIDQEVAERFLALDRGWSVNAAEEQMIADAEAEYEPPICARCNGTAEGYRDGSICGDCRGSGEERPDREVA